MLCGLLTVGLLAWSTQACAGEALCKKLEVFEHTAPDKAGERSWFEFHWGYDRSAIWSWGCRHSRDKTATATCAWLMNHTNQEFSMQLPQAIMTCYGYRFPKYASNDWDGIVGRIVLRGTGDNHLIMDLDYRTLPDAEVAVRVSREVLGETYTPDDLPPIAPMPKPAEEPPSTAR